MTLMDSGLDPRVVCISYWKRSSNVHPGLVCVGEVYSPVENEGFVAVQNRVTSWDMVSLVYCVSPSRSRGSAVFTSFSVRSLRPSADAGRADWFSLSANRSSGVACLCYEAPRPEGSLSLVSLLGGTSWARPWQRSNWVCCML